MATSTSPTASATSEQGSIVRPVACLRCRQRRSYCSKDKPKCSRCLAGAYECIYEEARKITVNEAYLRELEAKVKAYEDSIPRTRGDTTNITIRARNSIDENDDEFEDEHVLLGPFTQLTIDRPSTSFKGPGSSDTFFRNVRKLSGIHLDDGSLDQNPNFYEPGLLPSRRESIAGHVRLPPLDIARRLFASQYTYIGTIFAFTDPSSFEAELADAYRGGPPNPADRDACLAYAKVLVILAFGQLYSVNQWIDFKGPPGFEYFTRALQLLPDAHEEGSILCVETLALIGYFMQNMNRRDAAFLYIGMALRMAISLGLHQEVTQGDDATREHRRRVWWSIYSLDRILSIKSGNPITIADADIGVQLPTKQPDEPEYCPAIVLRHYTELSRILGDVTKAIYRHRGLGAPRQSGKRLMAAVQNIMVALSKWNAGLPEELRFDPVRLSISRESVSTFSHYYQCINMTARPLLFHVVQKRLRTIREDPGEKERDWKDGLSQTTVRVIDMCVSSAQDTINMMNIAAQRDLVATYGYMDGEHIFSASIVLVMVCVAFPTNGSNTAAMNAGLELLRGMAQRGNSHMGARYELLARLRSVVMAGSPAPDDDVHSLSLFPRTFSPVVASTAAQSPMTSRLVAAQAAMPAYATSPAAFQNLDPALVELMSSGGNGSLESTLGMASSTSGEVPVFPMVDSAQLGEQFYDENTNTGTDFMLWEEGFANPGIDAGYDLSQWTQAAQSVVDHGMGGL